jgi:NAD(P)-dependent dehydrogenase (short-subunit alcohol dehydrogenase family)
VTKGRLETVTRSLAMEYEKDGIRFNAVAYPRADATAL